MDKIKVRKVVFRVFLSLVALAVATAVAFGVFLFVAFHNSVTDGTQKDTVGSMNITYNYSTGTQPNLSTHIMIRDTKENLLYSYNIGGKFKEPKKSIISDTDSFECYRFSFGESDKNDFIIYNVNNQKYKSFDKYTKPSEISDEDKSSIDKCMKKLFMTKKMEEINDYGYYLLLLGDEDVKSCLMRYRNNHFTEEELSANKKNKDDMQRISVIADSYLSDYEKVLNSSQL